MTHSVVAWLSALSLNVEATAIMVLIFIQGLDILSGWLAAYITHALSSKASWRGVARKGLTLTAVAAVAALLPLLRHLPVAPALIIGPVTLFFIGTELISIAENLARAGIINPVFSRLAEAVQRAAVAEADSIPPATPRNQGPNE